MRNRIYSGPAVKGLSTTCYILIWFILHPDKAYKSKLVKGYKFTYFILIVTSHAEGYLQATLLHIIYDVIFFFLS